MRNKWYTGLMVAVSVLTLVAPGTALAVRGAVGPRGGAAVRGPRGGGAAVGPRGGTAVRGPHGGGAAVRGPYGGAAARGPHGGAAVRGPHGGYAAGHYHGGRHYYGGRYWGAPGWGARGFYHYGHRFAAYPRWRYYGTAGLAAGLAGYAALGFLSSGMLIGTYASVPDCPTYIYVVNDGDQNQEYQVDCNGNVVSQRPVPPEEMPPEGVPPG